MVQTSIVSQLGAGSGIDIRGLVDQLSAAARGPAEASLTARATRNSARVSALAEASGGIADFAASLAALVGTGALASRPSVSAPNLITATTIETGRLQPFTASVEIVRLASGQALESPRFAASSEVIGSGSLDIALADRSFSVSVAAGATLDDLAAAINAADGGIAARVMTDADGARLILRGPSGAASAFTIAAGADATPELARFAYPGGGTMSLRGAAADASIRVDGIELRSTTNRFDGAIAGVSLELKGAGQGTPITVGVERSVEALRTAVGDFVSAYNALIGRIDALTVNRAGEASGPARGDSAIASLRSQLGRLTGIQLGSATTSPRTLAEIGVKTNRDGTLTLDSARLSTLLTSDPGGVEAMFASATTGLPGAMAAIRDSLTTGSGGFASANARLAAEAKRITADREALDRRSERTEAQLLATFSAMDRRVSGFQATQSFLEQQVKIWTAAR